MKLRNIIIAAGLVFLVASCSSTKKITYFEDLKGSRRHPAPTQMAVGQPKLTIKPQDRLFIVVSTQNDELTQLYNLPYVTQRIGQTSASGYSYPAGVIGYSVSQRGEIDFPGIGIIKVAGLTREELAVTIQTILAERELAKEAVVTVDFMNNGVTVMGEVKNGGRFPIERDDMTVLDALACAGDLTICGVREDVTVFRSVNGVEMIYKIDLTSAESVFKSPAYYVQQNDVIYVKPNGKKSRESTVNGNNVRSASFWISLASLATSVGSIVVNYLPK